MKNHRSIIIRIKHPQRKRKEKNKKEATSLTYTYVSTPLQTRRQIHLPHSRTHPPLRRQLHQIRHDSRLRHPRRRNPSIRPRTPPYQPRKNVSNRTLKSQSTPFPHHPQQQHHQQHRPRNANQRLATPQNHHTRPSRVSRSKQY